MDSFLEAYERENKIIWGRVDELEAEEKRLKDRIEKLEAALRNIKDLHDQPGPEDELVVMIRDNMTYFIVCKALEGKIE